MILLDTNVLSELLREVAESAVLRWFATQRRLDLATTAINEAEVQAGLSVMREGRRKATLAASVSSFIDVNLGGRVLPFDRASAHAYGLLVALRRRAGRPLDGFDGPIGAVALAAGATIATRNVSDFAGCGLVVINPWTWEVAG